MNLIIFDPEFARKQKYTEIFRGDVCQFVENFCELPGRIAGCDLLVLHPGGASCSGITQKDIFEMLKKITGQAPAIKIVVISRDVKLRGELAKEFTGINCFKSPENIRSSIDSKDMQGKTVCSLLCARTASTGAGTLDTEDPLAAFRHQVSNELQGLIINGDTWGLSEIKSGVAEVYRAFMKIVPLLQKQLNDIPGSGFDDLKGRFADLLSKVSMVQDRALIVEEIKLFKTSQIDGLVAAYCGDKDFFVAHAKSGMPRGLTRKVLQVKSFCEQKSAEGFLAEDIRILASVELGIWEREFERLKQLVPHLGDGSLDSPIKGKDGEAVPLGSILTDNSGNPEKAMLANEAKEKIEGALRPEELAALTKPIMRVKDKDIARHEKSFKDAINKEDWLKGRVGENLSVLKGKVLLVIEDSKAWQDIYKKTFQAVVGELILAETATDAWRIIDLRGRELDLVILDMELPGTSQAQDKPVKKNGEDLLLHIARILKKPVMVATVLQNPNPDETAEARLSRIIEWRSRGGYMVFEKKDRTREDILRDAISILQMTVSSPEASLSSVPVKVNGGTLTVLKGLNKCLWMENGAIGSPVSIALTKQQLDFLLVLLPTYCNPEKLAEKSEFLGIAGSEYTIKTVINALKKKLPHCLTIKNLKGVGYCLEDSNKAGGSLGR